MNDEKENKSAKDYLLDALDGKIIDNQDSPTLPLVGSANVPITQEEEIENE